jgi:hypothetical protein
MGVGGGDLASGLESFAELSDLLEQMAVAALEAEISWIGINGAYPIGDAEHGWRAEQGDGGETLFVSVSGQLPGGFSVDSFVSQHAGHWVFVDGAQVNDASTTGSSVSYNIFTDTPMRLEDWRGAIGDAFEPWRTLPEEAPVRGMAEDLGKRIAGLTMNFGATGDQDVDSPGAGLADDVRDPHWAAQVQSGIDEAIELKGYTMDVFKLKFIHPMPFVVSNIQVLLLSTACTMAAQAGVIEAAKASVGSFARAGLTAMKASDRNGGGRGSKDSTKAFLLIAGAAAAAASTLLSGPVGLSAAAALAGTALGLGTSAVGGDFASEPVELGGERPMDVYQHIVDALTGANSKMAAEEAGLSSAFSKWNEKVVGDADSFGVPKRVDPYSDPDDREIVMNARSVGIVGALLVDVGGQVLGVARSAEPSRGGYLRDASLGIGDSGAFSTIQSCAALGESVCTTYAKHLEVASERLEEAYRHVAKVDGDVGADFRRWTDQVGDVYAPHVQGPRVPGTEEKTA